MVLRPLTAIGVGLATLFLAGAAFAAPAPSSRPADVTDVDSVTVTAVNDVRLTLAVGGDMAPDVVVTSAPIGMNCGAALFQYTPRENRQCWLWVRRNRPVMLTAQALGRFGVDWNVQWLGCEPVANGSACKLTPREEIDVTAVFSRMTP